MTDQAYIWRNVHESLIWVYYVCVLMALWGTWQVYPEIYYRVILDFSRSVFPGRNWSRRQIQSGVSLYVFAASMFVVWSDLSFDKTIHIVAFLATNLGVALAMLAALYLSNCRPPIAPAGGCSPAASPQRFCW